MLVPHNSRIVRTGIVEAHGGYTPEWDLFINGRKLAEVGSGYRFATSELAAQAADRAEAHFAVHDAFPNLCDAY